MPTITNANTIGVSLPVAADDGGSMILSYHLMIDDGHNGAFNSIAGDDGQGNNMNRVFTLSSEIVKGYTYRFKYRVKN